MFKIAILVCTLSLTSIQAYPVAHFGALREEAKLVKRNGCSGIGCGDGIQFTASNLSPSLTFSTGGRFNLAGMQPCGGVSGQPCAGAPPQVASPPPQAMPPSAPQGCDPAPGVQCADPPQQAPPQEMPPQQAPPQQAPPAAQGCDQAPGMQCAGESPQQPPPASGAAPCDQAQGQACASGPTAFNFSNSQNKDIKASSYKETTLYYNQKDAKTASKSASSNTQLNYTKN
ncbi:hypothetical protein GGI20_003209 [Coemansia sp. BCRC 34301]|nr:hypothetical protein GGI20_003209 [Coemansia sp. BCRC 34301]